MQVKQTHAENLKRNYDITVEAEMLQAHVDTKLAQLSKTVKIDGFRPGKVPLEVVKKNYGKNVMGEVLDQVIQQTSQEAIQQEKLRPALQPKIEIKKFEEGEDLQYTMELEIFPEVPEIDYSKIKLTLPEVEIDQKDIDEAIGKLAERSKQFVPVKTKRAAKKGDAVKIDFKGFKGDEPFEGGEGKGFQLELGSNMFIPGFEEQLIGSKEGEETRIEVKFPENYQSEDLAGQPAVFEIKVHEVLEAADAEINDALAEGYGFKDLKEMQEKVKEQLEKETGDVAKAQAKKELFDHLNDAYSFDVPEQMVHMEFHAVWDMIERDKQMNPDNYAGKSEEELKEEHHETAARRVRLGLLLSEQGNREGISVDQNETMNALIAEAQRYPGEGQQLLEYYKSNPEAFDQFRGALLEEKVVDHIIDKVDVTKKTLSVKELHELVEKEDGTKVKQKKKKTPAKKKAKKSE